jgi:hypothetical protein
LWECDGLPARRTPATADLPGETNSMDDLFYIALTIAFFAIAFAYVRGCNGLHGEMDDER